LEYKVLSKGVKIPVLGVGTWGLGGKHSADYSDDEKSVNAIQCAIDLGMTHVDTAEYYGAGHAEELVGKAIKQFNRDDLFLTTKVYRTHLRYADVFSSIKRSLRRLSTDYVDLFLVHWPDPEVPIGETMNALEACVDEGYTRFIGVSNFSASLFEEAQCQLRKHQLVANQLYYNLARVGKSYRNGLSVEDVISLCEAKDIMLIAWSPLEEGKLARPGFSSLDKMVSKYHKTQAQVALNWLISNKKIITIPKASNIDHIRENVGAVGWKLDDGDFIELREAFRLTNL
jgi:diketogulonate reductase-like aldo/keto reductase